MLKYPETPQGEFKNENNVWFSYRPTSNPWALSHGLNFEIDVLDGVRFANVLKTRVRVCIDESATGEPVMETWSLKVHHPYETNISYI